MARLFRFIDATGILVHTINDPDDRLPIPQDEQAIS